jgi:DNA-binding SARP family transcriptional activator
VFAFVDDDAPFAALGAGGGMDAAPGAPAPGDDGAATPAGPGPAAARTLRLDVLGPFAMRVGDAAPPPEAVPAGKARELVLWLLLHERGTKEEIGLALWPDASPAQVRNIFHVTLHHLRRQLGDPRWIAHERGAYRMPRRPGAGLLLDADVDAVLAAAARLRAAARRPGAPGAPPGGPPGAPAPDAAALDPAALDAVRAALERARGDLAEDAAPGEWVLPHRERVRGAWADGMEALAAQLAAAGRHDDARDVCERLVAREPLRESAHRQLMAALAAAGEPARALAHYDALARRLRRELGAPPSRETQRLAERLAAARGGAAAAAGGRA